MKIVKIRKYDPSSFFWNNLIRKNTYDLPVNHIINIYQGFEGELISVTNTAEDLDSDDPTNRIVCLLDTEETLAGNIHDKFSMVGYDYGICNESTIYSSIFNEILFGNIEVLVSEKQYLNHSLLFPSQELAKNYSKLHYELSLKGIDVEYDDEMKIYQVFSSQ